MSPVVTLLSAAFLHVLVFLSHFPPSLSSLAPSLPLQNSTERREGAPLLSSSSSSSQDVVAHKRGTEIPSKDYDVCVHVYSVHYYTHVHVHALD